MGIGERVRKRRVELGLTRNELVEKLHVTPSAVANLSLIHISEPTRP